MTYSEIRIAIIISSVSQLGPVKVIQTLVKSLSKLGILQIKVLYLDKNVDKKVKLLVPVERLVKSKFNFMDYDIIHTNGIRPDIFAFLNRKKIKYHISTIHNFVFDDLSFRYNKLVTVLIGYIWMIIWRKADKLVCVSETMKNYYAKWLSISKLEVIYNGITESDSYFVPEVDFLNTINSYRSNGFKIMVAVGILTKVKGMNQLLYLLAEKKDLALVIIGDGKEGKYLKHLSKKLVVADRCFFSGFRSNAVNYLGYFDLFIIPSRSEGFGLVLIEAVQQMVPVICSDLEVFKELFNSAEVTFFKMDDIQSLTDVLPTVIENGKYKAELAYARYKANYTDEIMAKHYFELYKSLTFFF